MAVRIERRSDPEGVDRILRALPAWFGIEESIVEYVANASRLPSYLAVDGTTTVGIALIDRHYPGSAEIHLIAVHPERHRAGVGAALVRAIKADLAADGVRLLQVHTVGPSFADQGYERTRASTATWISYRCRRSTAWAGPARRTSWWRYWGKVRNGRPEQRVAAAGPAPSRSPPPARRVPPPPPAPR